MIFSDKGEFICYACRKISRFTQGIMKTPHLHAQGALKHTVHLVSSIVMLAFICLSLNDLLKSTHAKQKQTYPNSRRRAESVGALMSSSSYFLRQHTLLSQDNLLQQIAMSRFLGKTLIC